ncbi:MAG: ribonuclease III [Clostridia bacterium]|nr:ribonuclease III [Clostridia bacterium]
MNSKEIYTDSFLDKAKALEEIIGHRYKTPEYLYTALTHSSFANELRAKKKDAESNERLEFLGDSVLSIVVSSYIFSSLSSLPEGELTRIRAYAVCEDALFAYAAKIGLGEYLALGRGEEKTDGRHRKSILADATEAIIASVYLDSGFDIESVKDFIMEISLPRIEEIVATLRKGGSKNYKGTLQQLVQNSRGDILEYEQVSESGPDHDKTFIIRVKLNSNEIGVGKGRSKQEAEQAAAREALILFGEKV